MILWIFLFEQCGIELFFAHQTFKWTNEARGRAAVYCIITGFSTEKREKKRIFSYPDIRKEATETVVTDINQYLMSSPSILIEPRRRPLSDTPPMLYGSKPVDGGYYLFTYEQKEEFIKKEPLSEKYFKKWVGASELVNSTHRYLG
ncbi:hypothetical protein H7J92_12065 [Sporosarcina aquimarina]|nr:type IIL restriction-modification enzyme MmeI [Sporosarcina aquimarina]MBY0223120.1 hypothetical protein [Sporosarcina aquimarina]